MELDLAGENTIRMTMEGDPQAFPQKWTLFINYMLFVPALAPPPVPARFSLEISDSNNGGFSFSFPTEVGVTNLPEYKTSLEVSPWTTLPAVDGDGARATIQGDRTESSYFYRVRTR